MYLEEAVEHECRAEVVATHTLAISTSFIHCRAHPCCQTLHPSHYIPSAFPFMDPQEEMVSPKSG